MTSLPVSTTPARCSTAADGLLARALERARALTAHGARDRRRTRCWPSAWPTPPPRARRARARRFCAERRRARAAASRLLEATGAAATALLVRSLRERIDARAGRARASTRRRSRPPSRRRLRAALRRTGSEAVLRAIGRHVAATRGRNDCRSTSSRAGARGGARVRRARGRAARRAHPPPRRARARGVHHARWPSSATSGSRCPRPTAAHELGNLAMILTTEELSRASLAAAGSLITRPEILAKALLQGGTEAQKKHWLPRIAVGRADGRHLRDRARRRQRRRLASSAAPSAASVGGRDGWLINGPKAWCTFAGRANVLALLARTDPGPDEGRARGSRSSSSRSRASTGTTSR